MQVRLELAQGKANVKRVVLRHDAVIGRSAECNLRIASSLVSRQHCRIRLRENGVFVEDLESSNGTFLNGTRLPPNKEVAIPPGAQLSVGGVKFLVKHDGAGMPGPGSTVDLPRQNAESAPESLTAEWGGPLSEGEPGAESFQPPGDEPLELEAASDGGKADEVVVPAAATDDLAGYELELDGAPVAPVVISPEAAAAEVIAASAGDEIDTLMVEPEEAPAEAFPSFAESESAEDAPATSEPEPEADASQPRKGGLKSLFGMWGKQKKPAPLAEASSQPTPVVAAAVPNAPKAGSAPPPAAVAAQASEEDVVGFLAEATGEDTVDTKSHDEDLGEFLKSLGGS